MQSNYTEPAPEPESTKHEEQKKLAETLKIEWKQMWKECFNDKVKAEGVSVTNYNTLKVEQGTIIQATKDFKALNFREILDEHLIENPDRHMEPINCVGGWNKFIKTNISKSRSSKKQQGSELNFKEKTSEQRAKKSGRGWLHKA